MKESRVKPFLRPGKTATEWQVGAHYISDGSAGPVADISVDADWLYICTDPHEGSVMLHIKTLPHLRRVLARIAKACRDA